MPYSKKHKAATRQKILDSAIALFSSKGYDQVSIDRLMQHANLTRGAFYAHFKNKNDVYEEAILASTRKSFARTRKPPDLTKKEWGRDLLSAYLSMEHVEQQSFSCPLAFLVSDIAHQEPEIRRTYTHVFKQLSRGLKRLSKETSTEKPGHNSRKQPDILAIAALMIGGVAIGRALEDKELSASVLKSCRNQAIELLEQCPH